MFQGRFWAASLAGGVTLFLVGFVLWGLLLMGFYEAHMASFPGLTREPMDLPHLFLGQFFWAVLLAVVIGRYAGIKDFAGGLKAGALLGFLTSLSYGLTQFSMMNLADLTVTLVDPLVSAIWSGMGGGVIGLVLGGGEAAEAA